MEQRKEYVSTGIQFHGRKLRSTVDFSNALKKARNKGSTEVRCYGTPVFGIDTKTNEIRIGVIFEGDVADKIRSGELQVSSNSDWKIDDETQKIIKDKEKRRLKNSTRVWHNK
jgi:hypothetical protein